MKKIILAVIALLSIGVVQAQFQVQQKQSMPEVIWRDGFAWATLYKQGASDGMSYYFIACRSTNQFDNVILINLGKKEKAIITLTQFYDLYKKGEIYELVDDKGEKFSAQCAPIKGFYIHKKGYAGYGAISLNQIVKMISAINEQ